MGTQTSPAISEQLSTIRKRNDLPEPELSQVVVRITTRWWSSPRGCHIRKDIQYLKRKCVGHNYLEEDVFMEEFNERTFTNLDEVPDGVYAVNVHVTGKDEQGHPDQWEFYLVPYE